MMLLSELVKLDTKKLNAMKKEDIVKSITGYGFQYTNMEKELAEAKKEIAKKTNKETAADFSAHLFLNVEQCQDFLG